jgi:hypothetical protein
VLRNAGRALALSKWLTRATGVDGLGIARTRCAGTALAGTRAAASEGLATDNAERRVARGAAATYARVFAARRVTNTRSRTT